MGSSQPVPEVNKNVTTEAGARLCGELEAYLIDDPEATSVHAFYNKFCCFPVRRETGREIETVQMFIGYPDSLLWNTSRFGALGTRVLGAFAGSHADLLLFDKR